MGTRQFKSRPRFESRSRFESSTRGGWVVGLLALLLVVTGMAAESKAQHPRTVPEETNYQKTRSHAEVKAFIESLRSSSAPFRVESLGRSTEGRDIPLLVVADDPTITPQRARREGKLVAYIQGNIHGGEVEGKEVCLMLLRHLCSASPRPWLDRWVLLVVPIYNCDGIPWFDG